MNIRFFQPQPPPNSIRLYHITSWRNLPLILSQGGLWCPRELQNLQLNPISSAHSHIQARRAMVAVKVDPGGTLHDYVPWGFAPRSPMLCAIAHQRLEDQQVSQAEMVHLITNLALVEQSDLAWAFTDGHAVMAFTKFFNSRDDLPNIDWALMRERFWNNTVDDGDRTRRRQAEFLIHHKAPLSLIQGIGVMDSKTLESVNQVLTGSEIQVPVQIKSEWYF
jgi:hypothetical protein